MIHYLVFVKKFGNLFCLKKLFCHFWISKIKYAFKFRRLWYVSYKLHHKISYFDAMNHVEKIVVLLCDSHVCMLILADCDQNIRFTSENTWNWTHFQWSNTNTWSRTIHLAYLTDDWSVSPHKVKTNRQIIMILKFLIVLFWYANLEC